jgi:hypothetical protein
MRGTRIIAEKPLLQFRSHTPALVISSAIEHLSQEDRKEFFDLDNNDYWNANSPDQLNAILTTNARPTVSELCSVCSVTSDTPKAILFTISRINHACIPNAEYSWNKAHTEGRIHIVRNIKEGEEITIIMGSKCLNAAWSTSKANSDSHAAAKSVQRTEVRGTSGNPPSQLIYQLSICSSRLLSRPCATSTIPTLV